jgi:hypothetical protein
MPQKTTIGHCTFLDSSAQMDEGPGNNQKRRKPICYSMPICHELCQKESAGGPLVVGLLLE